MSEPGLIQRILLEDLGPVVKLEETWDVTVPGCPVIVFDLHEFKKDTQAKTVTRTIAMSKKDWAELWGRAS